MTDRMSITDDGTRIPSLDSLETWIGRAVVAGRIGTPRFLRAVVTGVEPTTGGAGADATGGAPARVAERLTSAASGWFGDQPVRAEVSPAAAGSSRLVHWLSGEGAVITVSATAEGSGRPYADLLLLGSRGTVHWEGAVGLGDTGKTQS